MNVTAGVTLICLATLHGCGGGDLGAGFADQPRAVLEQVAAGSDGVSSAHPLASQAGAELLANGGNAADAAVATGFALSVVENSMSGLGGRLQILLRGSDGEFHGIDGQTQLGGSYRGPLLIPSWSGVETVGVPCVVAGLLSLHERFGSRPLPEVLAPAIRLAKNGYEILPGEVTRHQRAENDIRDDAVLAAVYLNQDGAIRTPGELFQQPDLARTLEAIASKGRAVFYEGEIAQQMAEDLRSRGSSVSYEDIASYNARDSTVVRTHYRGYEIVGTTAPANGTAVIAALNVLAQIDMAALPDTDWAKVISQTMAQILQITNLDDPNDDNLTATLSKETARSILNKLDIPEAHLSRRRSTKVVDPALQALAMTNRQVDWSGEAYGAFSHHTSHHVAADETGMMVSVTQTLGPNMGARVMTPGLGFLYAQTGGLPRLLVDVQPGDRPRTNIAPTIVQRDGVPVMVLGAAGGTLIPPVIVQVISRVIDRGASLAEAVAAPRVAPKLSLLTFSFAMDEMSVEMTPINGWAESDISLFESAGIEVSRRTKYSLLARVHAMAYDAESGLWTGVADPDWEGGTVMIDGR